MPQVEVQVLELNQLNSFLMALGYVTGEIMKPEFRAELVDAIKNQGLKTHHMIGLYQNLGILLAEANVSTQGH